jgi:5-(carboxyamino)imidazole ribonucleotide mutase
MKQVEVGIIMGSSSDAPIMSQAIEVLKKFDIGFEFNVVSAHRTPQKMFEYASTAEQRGLKIIIAGAGGAAHLPGMVAAITTLPVIGVPIKSSNSLDGWDSLLSIVQMPADIPVATVGVNGARNAGLLAVQILGTSNSALREKVAELKKENNEKVIKQNETLDQFNSYQEKDTVNFRFDCILFLCHIFLPVPCFHYFSEQFIIRYNSHVTQRTSFPGHQVRTLKRLCNTGKNYRSNLFHLHTLIDNYSACADL